TPGPSSPAGRPPRSRRFGEDRVTHPGGLVPREAPELEALGGLRPVPGHPRPQLVPVGLRVLPDAVVALALRGIRHRQPELPDLRHVPVEKLLPRLLVPLRLDPPLDDRVVLRVDR